MDIRHRISFSTTPMRLLDGLIAHLRKRRERREIETLPPTVMKDIGWRLP